MKRREFLTSSLAAGVAFGFPALVSARSPNAKVCHACIGTHGMAGADMRTFAGFKDLLDVVAVCDVDAAYLAEAKKLLPNARVYRDWRELLAAEGDRIDAVNVSTPDHTHTIISANAMRRGKHVYCQKPLCKKLDECRLLRRLAAETGVTTQLGTQFASGLGDRQIVAFLQQGVIGPVTRVCLYSTRNGMSRVRRVLEAPAPVPANLDWEGWVGPAPMTAYRPKNYHPTLWRMWRDYGSGWIGDLCIHVVSAPWIGLGLGATAPRTVEAVVDPEVRTDPVYKKAWPRYSHITWEFPGVAATGGRPFRMEWFSGIKSDPTVPASFLPPAEYEALFAKTPLKARSEEGRVIEGEKGWILAPHASAPMVLLRDGTVIKPPKLGREPNHHRQFAEQVARGGGATRSSFDWSTWMMESVVMGGVCEQLPDRRLTWNAAQGCFENAPDANALLKSAYRDGWTLAGL